ncbi:MAG: Na+/H+ antiporter NhaA [Verrucomicrobia bacterium]|nr:Na+/H+ antiporter NhaA [Verrucomicrobiota bacterium]
MTPGSDRILPNAPTSPLKRVARPVLDFVRLETAGGLILIAATAVALAWANSPWAQDYHRLWQTELALGVPPFTLRQPLAHWINDGLMTVFFLLVGLEIKRELLVGQLAGARKAALPMLAALGGMAVPAFIYACLNARHGPAARGWGVPMATDIAFSLAFLSLADQRRVPASLKVFLTALAIVDDLGAVVVIACCYTAGLSWPALAGAAGAFGALLLANRLGVRQLAPYLVLGVALWAAMFHSGVHATVAGVLVAFAVPLRSRQGHGTPDPVPLQRLERALHPWVSFGVMPLFALANAGLPLAPGELARQLSQPVALGVGLGLLLGKPAGILAACGLAVKVGWAEKPAGANWLQLCGAAALAGIGFTMSLFIANLAFPAHPELVHQAKAGILAGSFGSALAGLALCRLAPQPPLKRKTKRWCGVRE